MKVPQFKYIEKKNLWFTISLVLMLIGPLLGVVRFMNQERVVNWGIDFTGGSTMIISFEKLKSDTQLNQQTSGNTIGSIREILKGFNLEKSMIRLGNDHNVLIKTVELNNELRNKIVATMEQKFGKATILEADLVGPTIGAELRSRAGGLILFTLAAIMIYITWRFEFNYGIAATVALLHDALITISLAMVFMIEIDTAFVAAILTILGYSITDTVVIFDRIRENLKLDKTHQTSLTEISNLSINQTLRRSIFTAGTVIIFVISLLFFGGETIRDFNLTLLIGLTLGTCSSIFIASPILVMLSQGNEKES